MDGVDNTGTIELVPVNVAGTGIGTGFVDVMWVQVGVQLARSAGAWSTKVGMGPGNSSTSVAQLNATDWRRDVLSPVVSVRTCFTNSISSSSFILLSFSSSNLLLLSSSSSSPPSLCSSSSAACTAHTCTAASHAASVSFLSTAILRSAIALLMLSGNGLNLDLAQYCSLCSNFALTCSTMSPLLLSNCAGSVTVSVYPGVDVFAVVVGLMIEYTAIGAVGN